MILLAFACSSAPPEDTAVPTGDTAPADTVDPACAGGDDSTGEPVGTVDCTDDVCVVAEGPFWMGAADLAQPEQCPPRQVTLSAFAIGRTEVRAVDYDACVAAGACTEPAPWVRSEVETDDPGQLPVIGVDHDQAAAYCAWAGGRLPTEAEWEKAARGTEGARWARGDQPPNCTRANFREVTSYCELGVVPVGSYPDWAGPFGLLDTVGNAWEWVADAFDAEYYRSAPDVDPSGPDTCTLAVGGERGECTTFGIRGGAFNTKQETAAGPSRSFAAPTLQDVNLGFRCAWSL